VVSAIDMLATHLHNLSVVQAYQWWEPGAHVSSCI